MDITVGEIDHSVLTEILASASLLCPKTMDDDNNQLESEEQISDVEEFINAMKEQAAAVDLSFDAMNTKKNNGEKSSNLEQEAVAVDLSFEKVNSKLNENFGEKIENAAKESLVSDANETLIEIIEIKENNEGILIQEPNKEIFICEKETTKKNDGPIYRNEIEKLVDASEGEDENMCLEITESIEEISNQVPTIKGAGYVKSVSSDKNDMEALEVEILKYHKVPDEKITKQHKGGYKKLPEVLTLQPYKVAKEEKKSRSVTHATAVPKKLYDCKPIMQETEKDIEIIEDFKKHNEKVQDCAFADDIIRKIPIRSTSDYRKLCKFCNVEVKLQDWTKHIKEITHIQNGKVTSFLTSLNEAHSLTNINNSINENMRKNEYYHQRGEKRSFSEGSSDQKFLKKKCDGTCKRRRKSSHASSSKASRRKHPIKTRREDMDRAYFDKIRMDTYLTRQDYFGRNSRRNKFYRGGSPASISSSDSERELRFQALVGAAKQLPTEILMQLALSKAENTYLKKDEMSKIRKMAKKVVSRMDYMYETNFIPWT